MPGNIPRWYLKQIGADIFDYPNGEAVAVRLGDGALGDYSCTLWCKETWDGNFKPLASFAVYSNDGEDVSDIIATGGGWDSGVPTWRALRDGTAQYPGPDGLMTGMEAVLQRMDDWLAAHTVAECEASTRDAWFKGDVLGWCQPRVTAAIAGWVREAEPAPAPPPQEAFPPQAKGKIMSPLGLADAQGTLVRLAPDPAHAGNLLLTMIPTPQ